MWPTRSDQGQALYKIQPQREKVYLMETLFSMPVVSENITKYFVEQNEDL